MRISLDNIKEIPPSLGEGICIYGEPSEEVQEWCAVNGIGIERSGRYTNLILPAIAVEDLFITPAPYEYLDGFSPNLNKHLHLGHLSNLVLAKAFQAIGTANKTIAILGDTLTGQVSRSDALASFNDYCLRFDYRVDDIFFASEMSLSKDGLLEDGTYDGVDRNGKPLDYLGTKVFNIEGEKIVGVKKDGSTTYFYQDVALANYLQKPVLYLTGSEQIQHFRLVKKLFPANDHVPLGLVMLNGEKMSSRNADGTEKTEEEKKAFYAKDILEMLDGLFHDEFLSYNVLAGQILGSDPKSTKNIDAKSIANPNTSVGLYISYTTARLVSAGIEPVCGEKFTSISMGYAYVKALHNREPHHLFKALFALCMKIGGLYGTHRIADHPENKRMFSIMMMDLQLALKKLGMFSINSVIRPDHG